ncbi:MAG: hypothetical protein HYR56_30580 [Acidobacteria bacterium]|nr:hypothetical protein [Acidobacteriota bacterium]MBI3428429.1 hypothetical protein [Acidobacteriota bacterium]
MSIVAMTPRQSATAGSASCAVATYDAVGGFSTTSNPNGSWSYGWEATLGGAFTLNAAERTVYQGLDTWEGPDGPTGDFNFPLVSFNHTGITLNYASGVSQPANMLNLHPSYSGKLSVLRWTAPSNGWFNAVGLFQGLDTRNTTSDVHIRQNSTTALFDGNINGFGNQAPFNLTRYLTAGETLDFVVGIGSNGNYNADSTGLAVTITAGPVVNIADGDVAGLIAAINTANTNGCPTTINLAPNGTYTLTAVADYGLGESGAPGPAGLPYIRSQLTINGNGSTIQRSNGAGTPDFVIVAVSSSNSGYHHAYNANLTLNGMTLTGATLGALGITHGAAVIQNSTITQNGGGGINNFCGKLTLLNSTVSYNTTGRVGGGILLSSPCSDDVAQAYIAFSTIFENQNAQGINAAGQPYGPGYAIGVESGIPGDVIVKNSILASPTRAFGPTSACYAVTPISGGHNIAGDSSCGLTGPGDMVIANPLLGPLTNNGGPTPTHMPLCNSPAINAVPVADSTDVTGVPVTTDQRGVNRPLGAASDIGAVEVGATATVPILSTTGPWLQGLNPTFDYGTHDNTPPVVIDAANGADFTPGSTLTITYLSGTVQAGAGYPFNDANGLPGYVRNNCENFGCFPAFFMNPRPDLLALALVGAFTNNGVIVGYPFPIGNGPKTLTVPTGANQLSLGINDTRFSDNSGFFTVAVSFGSNAPVITSQPVSLTKCETQAATFAVAATGNGLTYQWRKNGTAISGATSSTFNLASVVAGDAGSYDVVVTGACGSATSNAATLAVNTAPLITNQPASLTKCEGQSATFSVIATGTGLSYQWRKNGGNIPGATNNSFTIAAVSSNDAGSYDVVVSGTCNSLASRIATLTVNASTKITSPPANLTKYEGQPATFSVTATGTALSYQWRKGGVAISGATNSSFTIAAVNSSDAGAYDVIVTGACGGLNSIAAILTVLNVAPTVGAITAPLDPIPVNTTLNPSASFTDPGTRDTHTAVWNWDDPSNPSSAGTVTESNGSGSVSGSHSFTAAGVYEIKLTVTDDDGGVGQAIFQYVVVYDPNGGFVTGGGWIDSPAGAYGPDPTLTGRANFGFVSKYERGANVPTGNTEFQFKAGNFNFQSTVYEWLVVAGAKAQYKGSGKVNGAGDYRFMLTAIDGQINGGGGVDKFRIKIWDNASGGVIYDNKRGDSDELDSANPQALGGGSIVIHKDK